MNENKTTDNKMIKILLDHMVARGDVELSIGDRSFLLKEGNDYGCDYTMTMTHPKDVAIWPRVICFDLENVMYLHGNDIRLLF